nr:WD40 repeat domain-containing protein [Micromonospora sp. DSM 115978]
MSRWRNSRGRLESLWRRLRGRATVDDLVADPAFLILHGPDRVGPLLDRVRGPAALAAASVYRFSTRVATSDGESGPPAGSDPARWRQVLTLSAARMGFPELAAQLTEADVPGVPAAAREIVWATGNRVGLLSVLTRYDDWVTAIDWADPPGRGRVLVTGHGQWAERGRVRLSDPATARLLAEPVTGVENGVAGLTVLEVDGRPAVMTCTWTGVVRAWDLATGEPAAGEWARLPVGFAAVALAVLDGEPIAIAAEDGGPARRWELRTGRPMATYPAPVGEPEQVAITRHADVLVLAVADSMGAVTAWEARSGRQIGSLDAGRSEMITAVGVESLRGRLAVVTARSRESLPERGATVVTRDLATGERILPDLDFPEPVLAVRLSPDGDLIVGFGPDLALLRPRTPIRPARRLTRPE